MSVFAAGFVVLVQRLLHHIRHRILCGISKSRIPDGTTFGQECCQPLQIFTCHISVLAGCLLVADYLFGGIIKRANELSLLTGDPFGTTVLSIPSATKFYQHFRNKLAPDLVTQPLRIFACIFARRNCVGFLGISQGQSCHTRFRITDRVCFWDVTMRSAMGAPVPHLAIA